MRRAIWIGVLTCWVLGLPVAAWEGAREGADRPGPLANIIMFAFVFLTVFGVAAGCIGFVIVNHFRNAGRRRA
jgi:hypothetical protein